MRTTQQFIEGRRVMIEPIELGRLLHDLKRPLLAAGGAILEVYSGAISVRGKADASPVTDADERAEAIVVDGLAELTPELPVIAEESVAAGRVPEIGERFWLVDPLDGTREFVSRNGEFTVNVALVERGRPVLGVVLAPALGALYSGAEGVGATIETVDGARHAIRARRPPDEGLTVVASRSHADPTELDAFLAGRPVRERISVGSSLKLCLLAEGRADLYPRLGPTMEWDIAAGHAVLAAAGGRVNRLDGSPFRYGKPGFENPPFVARGLAATD